MALPASTFPTEPEDGPQNANAVAIPSNYEICDRTGFKVQAGGLVNEWNGAMVRRQSWESRHPQDFVRARTEKQNGSPRPEQAVNYIADDAQIEASDL